MKNAFIYDSKIVPSMPDMRTDNINIRKTRDIGIIGTADLKCTGYFSRIVPSFPSINLLKKVCK